MIRVVALIALASTAHAQASCFTQSDLAVALKASGYDRAGYGMDPASHMAVELYTGPHGAWAAINLHADGSACIVQQGTDWHSTAPNL